MNPQGSASRRNPESAAQERPGFVQVPNRVVFDQSLTNTEYRILTTIMAHDWGDRGGGCRLSYERIGQISAGSESSVKRAIKKLQHVGYLYPPQPIIVAGRRYSTVLRVTPLARECGPVRPEIVPSEELPRQATLDDRSKLDPFTMDPSQQVQVGPLERVQGAHHDGSSLSSTTDQLQDRLKKTNTDAAEKRFKIKGFRPDVLRVPLLESDVERLRILDEWGCPDSQDWLALMFGILAQRKDPSGHSPDERRIRAAFDGAVASRSVKRAANPLGMLLAGIERGFLLATPRTAESRVMPPGARSTLETYVQRAMGGHAVDPQNLSGLGISQREFNALVAEAREAAGSDGASEIAGQNERAAANAEEADGSKLDPLRADPELAAVIDAFMAEFGEPTVQMWVLPAKFVRNGNVVEARCNTRFAADRLRDLVRKLAPKIASGLTIQVTCD
jgi:hypothetical protein